MSIPTRLFPHSLLGRLNLPVFLLLVNSGSIQLPLPLLRILLRRQHYPGERHRSQPLEYRRGRRRDTNRKNRHVSANRGCRHSGIERGRLDEQDAYKAGVEAVDIVARFVDVVMGAGEGMIRFS